MKFFFSPCVFIFSPLGHAIIVLLSQTVYWGENIARGKSNHTMFHKIMGNSEKNAGNRGHNIIFFPLLLIVTLKKAQKSNWGKIYDIFFPLCLYFFPLRPCNNCSTVLSQTVYWGENIAREKSNHIFPAGHNLFL
jgi:hypothetical protein